MNLLIARVSQVTRALQRKYRNISRAVMEDPMFFFDEIFAIEPLSGRIWSRSKCEVTATDHF